MFNTRGNMIASQTSTIMSIYTVDDRTPSDLRGTLRSYPVRIGDVVEVRMEPNPPIVPSVMQVRVLRLERIGHQGAVAYVRSVNDPAEYSTMAGLLVLLSFSEIVLPWWCIFTNPLAWYVTF